MRNLMFEEFALEPVDLGLEPNERFAYIREINQDEASAIIALDTEGALPAGTKLYAIRAEDGKLIGMTDSRDAAWWTALSNDFSPLSVH